MRKGTLKYVLLHYQLYLMLALPVLYFVIFKYLPMAGISMAFLDFDIIAGFWHSDFVGLAHFREAFASSDFWQAVWNTLLLNFGDFVIGFPIPIVLAVALNELTARKIRRVTQVSLFLPYFLSMVIIAGIVFQVFSTEGFANHMVGLLGLRSVNFLGNPAWWRAIYWGTGVWQSAGYSLIISTGREGSVGSGTSRCRPSGRRLRCW
jgi:putative aldouronate transport system permease protein